MNSHPMSATVTSALGNSITPANFHLSMFGGELLLFVLPPLGFSTVGDSQSKSG